MRAFTCHLLGKGRAVISPLKLLPSMNIHSDAPLAILLKPNLCYCNWSNEDREIDREKKYKLIVPQEVRDVLID